jgi:hypothetical protein
MSQSPPRCLGSGSLAVVLRRSTTVVGTGEGGRRNHAICLGFTRGELSFAGLSPASQYWPVLSRRDRDETWRRFFHSSSGVHSEFATGNADDAAFTEVLRTSRETGLWMR